MQASIRSSMVAVAIMSIGLFGWAGCNVTIEVGPDGGEDVQVGGATPTDGGTAPNTGGTAPADDGTAPAVGDVTPIVEGNPDSPCADQTNIYVSYVNKSSARVGFVENFRDETNKSLAASIFVLQSAGAADDARHKCIVCPYQAGIRNIKYIRDGVQTAVPYPADLLRGSFSCGDHITFVFNENGSVNTSVETP